MYAKAFYASKSTFMKFTERVIVRLPHECAIWVAGKTPRGYGRLAHADTGEEVYAHRFAYEYFIGPIPEGFVVDHLCGNTSCVNPLHLEAVSQGENIRRGNRTENHRPIIEPTIVDKAVLDSFKWRDWNCCRNGHEYTDANTYISPKGQKACRICERNRAIRRRQKTEVQ